MPLTPEDVSNKRFTPVSRVSRREGYEMAEVDAFLDEVESELARLIGENADLRSRLGAAPRGEEPSAQQRAEQGAEEPVGPAPERPAGSAQQAPEPLAETMTVTTAAEASTAATRLLEIATRNADELVGEARAEAEKIRTEARTEAERLTAESRERAERLEADARTRSEMLESETAERRQRLFGDLEAEKERLNGEIDNLRSFEREYRARLKSYFEQQLAALGGSGEDGVPPGERAGSLSSLLGDHTESS